MSVEYRVTSSWTAGFIAEIVVTNNAPWTIFNWQLAFSFEPTITSIWNGSVVSHAGARYVVGPVNATWEDGALSPGNSITIGLVASGSSAKAPYDGTLNGVSIVFNGRVPAPGPRPSLAPIAAPPWPQHALAPYIDATSWPLFDFVSAAKNQGVRNFRLGFVVASSPTQATPSWGGYYDAASGYRLQEVNALRRLGGDVAVSFGGSNGTELAGAATSVEQLRAVYQSVIDAYGARVCDFDIEGVWIGDPASIARRSQAIAAMQAAMAAKGRPLEVWYTIPAAPSGLTGDGIKVVQSAISYGVSLRGVNIMAMDYGDSVAPAPQGRMGTYAVDAANGLFRQLQSLYSRNGKTKLPNEIWRMIGVTPMIGVNDVPTEIFWQSDAQKLLAFAKQKKFGLLSFWSINRDHACEVNRSSVNPTCSGIPQTPHQFTQILRPFAPSATTSGAKL